QAVSAAVHKSMRRERSAMSVVRGAGLDPLADHRQRFRTGRARRRRGLTAAEARIVAAIEAQLDEEETAVGVAGLDADEAALTALAVCGGSVDQRGVRMADKGGTALDG